MAGDMPINRPRGTGMLNTGNLPTSNPTGGATTPTGGATTPTGGTTTTPAQTGTGSIATDANALGNGRRTGTSTLSLPAGVQTAYNSGSGANSAYNAATGMAANAGNIGTGVQQIADGDIVGGVMTAGNGAVGMVGNAQDMAKGTREAANIVRGGNNVVGKTADSVTNAIGEGTRIARGAQGAGGALAVVGGGMQVANGIQQIRDGNVAQGALTTAGGAVSVLQGAGNVASAVAPAGRLATSVVGRAAPILGVAAGAIEVGQALAKTPPDYTGAATGTMNMVGSALLPFAPVGTAVGGALIVGAAVINNFDAIKSAGAAVGNAVGNAASAAASGISNAASAAGNAIKNAFSGW